MTLLLIIMGWVIGWMFTVGFCDNIEVYEDSQFFDWPERLGQEVRKILNEKGNPVV